MTEQTVSEEVEDGNAAIDKIAKLPNMDKFYDRNSHQMTDEDFLDQIKTERERRAIFIEKKGK